MGQAGSAAASSRERHKSGDVVPSSPMVQGHAFTFEKKKEGIIAQSSQDEDYGIDAVKWTGIIWKQGKEAGDVEMGKEYELGTTPVDSDLIPHAQVEDVISNIIPTVFKWDRGGKDVFISGTFTGWKKIPMVKSHGDFVTIVDLPEGEHQYKFFVDGEWVCNPKEPVTDNDIGSKNNVVKVQPSDFEVFEALETDSHSSNHPPTGSPPNTEYAQDVPVHRPSEKGGPPVLPPHLLQVILNKDTPISCEPTLLPEPNHVMLNHLYALSIKDGVMVLSATHRYRKKYVTTLLYKPI